MVNSGVNLRTHGARDHKDHHNRLGLHNKVDILHNREVGLHNREEDTLHKEACHHKEAVILHKEAYHHSKEVVDTLLKEVAGHKDLHHREEVDRDPHLRDLLQELVTNQSQSQMLQLQE